MTMRISAAAAIDSAVEDLKFALFSRREFSECSKRSGTREKQIFAAKRERAALRRTCALIRLARKGAQE